MVAPPAHPAVADRERRIIGLRFYHQLTQSEIAAELGISQMHVSRLLNRSLTCLREEMLSGTRRLARGALAV